MSSLPGATRSGDGPDVVVGAAADGGLARRRRRVNLGRLAVFGAVLTVLVAADALYMHLTGYQPGDRHRFGLSDAGELAVAAGLLASVTVALLTLWRRAGSGRA